MNTRILLLALSAAALSSCSTMYKSGQTPDDVYYSPGQEQVAVVQKEDDPNTSKKFSDQYTDMNDRYLRMKSSSQRWSAFDDDFMYWNNPTWNSQFMFNSWGSPYYSMGYGTGYGYGGWYGSIGFSWGTPYYMNPFCPVYYGQPVVIVNPKPVYGNPKANGPRTYNLSAFNRTPKSGSVYIDPKTGGTVYGTPSAPGRAGIRVFNSVSAGSGSSQPVNYSGSGSSSRQRSGFLQSDNSKSSRSSSSPSRTFESSRSNNSSSGSSSSGTRSSGSSGSSAPTRSFPRGGGN
jgi:hypothetical protein